MCVQWATKKSSSNKLVFGDESFDKLIYIRKDNRPKIYPWGTYAVAIF